jgi:hypothetical protein
MLTTRKLIIFTLLALAVSAYAQSQREQLQQMVEQLQKTPNDNALRERIIKLAQTIKPAPALPEEALRYEGRARAAFQTARQESDYLDAAKEYRAALLQAPWVAGYYSDLCTNLREGRRLRGSQAKLPMGPIDREGCCSSYRNQTAYRGAGFSD